MKLKRILAWVIDWNLCGIPAIICAYYFDAAIIDQGLTAKYALIFVLGVISLPLLFVFRDVLCNGRSVAKRIFKLCVIDNATNAKPTRRKLIIRNLFFFIYPAEAIMLLAINKTLGDMVTNTTVVKK